MAVRRVRKCRIWFHCGFSFRKALLCAGGHYTKHKAHTTQTGCFMYCLLCFTARAEHCRPVVEGVLRRCSHTKNLLRSHRHCTPMRPMQISQTSTRHRTHCRCGGWLYGALIMCTSSESRWRNRIASQSHVCRSHCLPCPRPVLPITPANPDTAVQDYHLPISLLAVSLMDVCVAGHHSTSRSRPSAACAPAA